MFPLHQSNELCFQISPNPHKKQAISEDLILGRDDYNASLEDHNALDANMDYNQIKSRPHRKLLLPTLSNNNNPQSSNDNKTNKKKMKHRDIERQRRQEMASLHASLRSLLPLQLIKGKRSISDHINEAARYIKHLKAKIKELSSKRDELKIKYLSDSSTSTAPSTDRHGEGMSSNSSSTPAPGRLTVQPCCSGVEIVVSTTGHFDEGSVGNLPLSRVLEVILGEGLSVVSCVSTKVNGRFLHTIQSEAGDRECINMSALEQKLKGVFFPF